MVFIWFFIWFYMDYNEFIWILLGFYMVSSGLIIMVAFNFDFFLIEYWDFMDSNGTVLVVFGTLAVTITVNRLNITCYCYSFESELINHEIDHGWLGNPKLNGSC